MLYFIKVVVEINEDMVQILLMLQDLFAQDSKVEDLFCGAPSLFLYENNQSASVRSEYTFIKMSNHTVKISVRSKQTGKDQLYR